MKTHTKRKNKNLMDKYRLQAIINVSGNISACLVCDFNIFSKGRAREEKKKGEEVVEETQSGVEGVLYRR